MIAILPIASFDDVGAVEIWDGKHLAATQVRPPNPPAICTVSVTASAVNGGDYILNYTTTAHWSTPLTVHVDILVSPLEETEVWKHIHSTVHPPHTTSMAVPLSQEFIPYHLSTSARVTLSNDFAVTKSAVTSSPFASAGSPPLLTVIHSAPGHLSVIHAGSSVYLHAEAWDDRRDRIPDANIIYSVMENANTFDVARGMLSSWKTARGMKTEIKELVVKVTDYKAREVQATVKLWLE